MFNINDIKNGVTFVYEGNIYQVVEFLHVKPGKGSAFIKSKLRNLRTGSTIEKTFNTNIKLEKAVIDKQPMQFLYETGDVCNFMNMETYEQSEIDKKQLGDDYKYLKESLDVEISFYEGELLGMILPEKVIYEVTQTDAAVKGNTTNNAQKDAILENGLTVRVPLFIENGEKIVVSTSTGKYDSRA